MLHYLVTILLRVTILGQKSLIMFEYLYWKWIIWQQNLDSRYDLGVSGYCIEAPKQRKGQQKVISWKTMVKTHKKPIFLGSCGWILGHLWANPGSRRFNFQVIINLQVLEGIPNSVVISSMFGTWLKKRDIELTWCFLTFCGEGFQVWSVPTRGARRNIKNQRCHL